MSYRELRAGQHENDLSPTTKRKIVEDYTFGAEMRMRYSVEAIAKRYGISSSRVSAIAKEQGICRYCLRSPSPKSPSTYSHPTSKNSRKRADTDTQSRSENL
jgi:hypothetical protein